MSERLLLIDTDILVLLGASGMLPRVVELLEFQHEQVRRLPAATYQLERSRSFRDAYPAPVLHAALQIARTIQPIRAEPSTPLMVDALSRVSDVDLGEAWLFALLAEHSGYYMTTGDKKAIIAVATHDGLSEVRDAVAGRVICLESLLKLLVQREGAKTVAEAFAPVRTHRTISWTFANSQMALEK